MSAPQAIPPIHPRAELQETAFLSGIFRQRCLMLASENLSLKDRITALEASEKTLHAKIEHLEGQMAETEEAHYGNPT